MRNTYYYCIGTAKNGLMVRTRVSANNLDDARNAFTQAEPVAQLKQIMGPFFERKNFTLSDSQKESIRDGLKSRCNGTPLQPNAEFVANYLGEYVISLIEERDSLFNENDTKTQKSH
jgi:hypothetical protein